MKQITSIIVFLCSAMILSEGALGNELCLRSWDGNRDKQVGYVGNGGDIFGDFCLRVTMWVSNDVGGQICLDLDTSGAMTYDLQGSSFNTGKDCYSYGYNDSMERWSQSCVFTTKDRFFVRTKSVNKSFCDERQN